MSIWQRLRESIAGISRGEKLSDVFARLRRKPEHTIAFAIAIIALAAKMAKADGQVTRDEISAFREIFHIPPEEERNAARIYNLARQDVAGFDSYARQIAAMFTDRRAMLRDILEGLVYVAAADGVYHPNERVFLEEVARIFAIPEDEFRSIRARHLPGENDPFAVLGLEPGADRATIRVHYRALVRELHPDRLVAMGVPEEARRFAERRLAAVNEAYSIVIEERRITEEGRARVH